LTLLLLYFYEFDVLDGTVVMPWIVEEVAGAMCGLDCLLRASQSTMLNNNNYYY